VEGAQKCLFLAQIPHYASDACSVGDGTYLGLRWMRLRDGGGGEFDYASGEEAGSCGDYGQVLWEDWYGESRASS
jgi:hypothetical protein